MKKINANNAKEIIDDISNILNESYKIGGPEEEIPQEEIPDAPIDGPEEELPTNHGEDIDNIDFTKSSIGSDDNEVINNIRKLALEGIQRYAEQVTSPLYDFYKKIWAECDKLITDAAKKQEIGGKH